MKEMLVREGDFLLQILTPGDLIVRPVKALHQRPGVFYLGVGLTVLPRPSRRNPEA